MKRLLIVGLGLMLLITAGLAGAAKKGQNVSIQYGTVTGAKKMDLNAGAAPAGALVGGSIGLLSSKGKSSSRKARNALIGGMVGSAVAGSARTQGVVYDVDLGPNGRMQVVTDQLEIRNGDCVAVERAGDTANIRRVSASYCEPANARAVAAVQDEAEEEAEECLAAKEELVRASNKDAAELAAMKINLLCND